MNIPEGFVLVPVEAQIEKSFDVVGGKHFPTIKITLPACNPDDSCAWNRRDSIGSMVGGILSGASTYDEAAELAACRANWEKNPNCIFSDMWLGWKACAQSRDGSVEE